MYSLAAVTTFFIVSITASINSPRLLQASQSLVIPQVLLSNILNASTTLIASVYQPFILNHNITKVEGTQSDTYKLTYSNGDTAYVATIYVYPNNTVTLLDFSQVGWDAISPFNIPSPLIQTNTMIKTIYQLQNTNLVQINHTFRNNIHNYSLNYQSPKATHQVGVTYNLQTNTSKIYSFQSPKYQDPLFKQLPLNFSFLDSNLKDAFKMVSSMNGTAGFVHNQGTVVNLIANSVSNNGKDIIYYLNLITEGKTLEALVSARLVDGIRLIYFRVWGVGSESSLYPNINIVNAWEDPAFVRWYYSVFERDSRAAYISQVQGSYQDTSVRKILLVDGQGNTATTTF